MDIVVWLRSLGLGRYEAAFRDNEIDETVLPNLLAEDLKDLGVSVVGHRHKLLDAIAALRTDEGAKAASSDAAETSSAPTVSPEHRAERRKVTRMDPEDLREVISTYQNCVAETVRRFGGYVANYMGDGALDGLELITAVSALKTLRSTQVRSWRKPVGGDSQPGMSTGITGNVTSWV